MMALSFLRLHVTACRDRYIGNVFSHKGLGCRRAGHSGFHGAVGCGVPPGTACRGSSARQAGPWVASAGAKSGQATRANDDRGWGVTTRLSLVADDAPSVAEGQRAARHPWR